MSKKRFLAELAGCAEASCLASHYEHRRYPRWDGQSLDGKFCTKCGTLKRMWDQLGRRLAKQVVRAGIQGLVSL